MSLVDEMFESRTVPPKHYHRRPEAEIQKQIVRWLREHGVLCVVTDAGASFGTEISVGWPDITGCTGTGRFVGVECKAPRGKQHARQAFCQEAVEKRGGIYILAHSVEDVKQAFAKEKLLENLL